MNSATNLSIPGLLCSHLPLSPNNSCDNPVVRHTVRTWAQCGKHFERCNLSLLSQTLFFFQIFHWRSRWRCFEYDRHLKHLYFHDIFASFKKLSEKYQLQKTFFRYFQMRNYLRSQTPNFPRKLMSSIADMFLNIDPSQKHIISFIIPLLLYSPTWHQFSLPVPVHTCLNKLHHGGKHAASIQLNKCRKNSWRTLGFIRNKKNPSRYNN